MKSAWRFLETMTWGPSDEGGAGGGGEGASPPAQGGQPAGGEGAGNAGVIGQAIQDHKSGAEAAAALKAGAEGGAAPQKADAEGGSASQKDDTNKSTEDEGGGPASFDEIAPPEGFDQLDEVSWAKARPMLEELGATPAQAQELVNAVGDLAKRQVDTLVQSGQEAAQKEHDAATERMNGELKRLGYDAATFAAADHPAKMDAYRGIAALLPPVNEAGKPLSQQEKFEATSHIVQQLEIMGAVPLILPLLARMGRYSAADTSTGGGSPGSTDRAAVLYPGEYKGG